jgi:hypothetical protein
MDVSKLLSLEPRTWDFISVLEPKVGLVEHIPNARVSDDLISIIRDGKKNDTGKMTRENGPNSYSASEKIIQVPNNQKAQNCSCW